MVEEQRSPYTGRLLTNKIEEFEYLKVGPFLLQDSTPSYLAVKAPKNSHLPRVTRQALKDVYVTHTLSP